MNFAAQMNVLKPKFYNPIQSLILYHLLTISAQNDPVGPHYTDVQVFVRQYIFTRSEKEYFDDTAKENNAKLSGSRTSVIVESIYGLTRQKIATRHFSVF